MKRIGFQQTEIGLIPEDWSVVKLTDIGEVLNGLTYHPSNVRDYGTLVLRSSNVQNGALSFKDNVFVKMSIPKNVLVRENDILICVRNGSKQLIGKCALIDKRTEGSAFGAFMSVLRSDMPLYSFYQFQSDIIQKQINEALGATINQITKGDFNRFIIPLPGKVKEQSAIAQVLSDTDALILGLKQLIAKKEKIKQGAMQELLTGRTRLQDENGKTFEGEWEEKKLGEIANVIGGGTPKTNIKEYWNGNINWFTPTEVGNSKYLYKSQRKITGLGLSNSSAKLLPIGTILLTSRAGIGDLGILKVESCTNQGFQSLVGNDKVDNEFLYYYIQIKKNSLLEKASGSTFLEISPNSVRDIDIKIPSTKKEQTAIAQALSDMDAEIEALENRLHKTEQLKQGLMQELLTGKTRLDLSRFKAYKQEVKMGMVAEEGEEYLK